jgi:6,7-dimethyl-8-ribityllumazine synthase
MATQGNITLNKGIPTLRGAFVVIIKTEWNEAFVNRLEKGVKKIFRRYGIKSTTLTVPGAIEIPFAVKQHYAYSKKTPDAYITLGTVIRGGTPHFDYVCQSVTGGIAQLNLTIDVPVIFGILTVDNEQQVIERTGGIHGNKGEEFAVTAIKMIALNNKLR